MDEQINIVFFDLDNTLLNSQKEISIYSKNILRRCRENGIIIGCVTSRTTRKIEKICEGLDLDFYACINGGYIKCNSDIAYQGLDWDETIGILQNLEVLSYENVSCFFEEYCVWNGWVFLNNKAIKRFEELPDMRLRKTCQRIRIYNCDEDTVSKAKKLMVSCNIAVYWEQNDLIIESKKVTKGNAVKRVLTRYGVDNTHALCFGDDWNDLSMFCECGYSVAMSNSPTDLLFYADYITSDNDSDGVAAFLADYVLPTKKHKLVKRIKGSLYKDCIYMLENMQGRVSVVSREQRRLAIESGEPVNHYICIDPIPTKEQNLLFEQLVEKYKYRTAEIVGTLSESIISNKGKDVVLVSLARGGVIYGALCRQYIKSIYRIDVPHYVISIIRGIGIDKNAIAQIVSIHGAEKIQFIDGWTGSGVIARELNRSISEFNQNKMINIDPNLAVAVDTSHICEISGTRDDVLLPDCCMNATVCGLMSSIYYQDDNSYAREFHGAMYLHELEDYDVSKYYLQSISSCFSKQKAKKEKIENDFTIKCLNTISNAFEIKSNKLIRMGIGETTRAIYRSKIKVVLANNPLCDELFFVRQWCKNNNISIIKYNTMQYSCIAILEE